MLRRVILGSALVALGGVANAATDPQAAAPAQAAAKAPAIEIDRAASDIAGLEYVSYSDGTLAMVDQRQRVFRGTVVDPSGLDLLGKRWRETSIGNLARKHLRESRIQWGATGSNARVFHLLMDPADVRAMRIDEQQAKLAERRIGLVVHLVSTGIYDRSPALIAQVACDADPKARLAATQRAVLDAGKAEAPRCAANAEALPQAALDGLYRLHMGGVINPPPIVLSPKGELLALADGVQEIIARVDDYSDQAP